jgi:2-keto-4-pentenoate hydratase/2-oxohepta-3-ene-1,7-dioic acid hydratase in catechol pathway
MRLVTYEIATPLGPVRRVGALAGDEWVVDLTAARAWTLADGGNTAAARTAPAEIPTDMLELLRLGPVAIERARESVDRVVAENVDAAGLRHRLSDVRLLAPLPRPNSLRDFMVVEEHVRNSFKTVPPEWFNLPVYWRGNVDAIFGPEDTIAWPAYTEKLDYELEICAVIGSGGRRITAQDAPAHIVGYTIYNDWSARDIQFREMSVGIGPGVGKDFASSIGPCIATPDEFDRDNALLEARIDGEVWSSGQLGAMRFSFEDIVEWLSQEQTLHPGDLLGSGTIGGGCGLELDRWLAPGCTVELSAEGIGVLRNTVSQRPDGPLIAPRSSRA